MEGTVALKHALVARGVLEHATVRSPLLPLPDGADKEIHTAVEAASLETARLANQVDNGSNGAKDANGMPTTNGAPISVST